MSQHPCSGPLVTIQTSAQSVPSTPWWFGEVAMIAHYLTRLGLLDAIADRVRFARRRFGQYDVIDFVAVLIGYALSGEPTSKHFMTVCFPSRPRSWRCSDVSAYHTVRLSAVFSQHSIRPPLTRCERSSLKICSLDLSPVNNREGCGIGRERTPWCSMSIGRGKLRDSERYHRLPTSQRPSGASTRSARQDIWGASVAKSPVLARPFFRCIRTSGSGRFPVDSFRSAHQKHR